MKRRVNVFGLLALVAVLAACHARGSAAPYERLDDRAANLRSAFNADAGKVRIVMLLSPT